MIFRNFNFRFYFVIVLLILLSIVLCSKLIYLQIFEGDKYKKIAKERTLKNIIVKPIPGNIYSDDQSLLATTVSKYELRWDSKVVSDRNFKKHKEKLALGISTILNKDLLKIKNDLEDARIKSNRYWLVGKNLSYSKQKALKKLLPTV